MTKKKSTVANLTAEEYKERFPPYVLKQLLKNVDTRDPKSESYWEIMQEVPKIREALGQETLTTAEIREAYAYRYAAARDPYPYQSDIDAGRAEFDAWLRAYEP